MKLTSTTTSTSLYELIRTTNPQAIRLIEEKRIKNELNWGYWVEIVYAWSEINVETILNEASSNSRPVNSTLPIFAFNCKDIHDIYIYGSWDFYLSIV